MSRPTAAARRRPAAGRRGTILVVVLALLAIFAVIGISFVFYSDGEALMARYAREAEDGRVSAFPDPPTDFDSNAMTAVGQLVFGDYSRQTSGFRGHDLMTTIYGGQGKNTDPYTGQGIFHEKLAAPFDVIPSRGHVVNYTPLPIAGTYYAFDPEITGPPRSPAMAGDPLPTPPADMTMLGAGQTYVSKAAPYTYPDLNNFYLAALSPATGEVILPSFYRPWHFNSNPVQLGGDTTPPAAAPLNRRLEPWNPNDPVLKWNTDWVIPEGRAKILRPRPVDQLLKSDMDTKGLPYPLPAKLNALSAAQVTALYDLINEKIRSGDIIGYPRPNQDNGVTGDVFNQIGGVGVQRNDSILIDFGGEAKEWPPGSGRWVKPLAAVLVSDLDGLLNLNAHGNVRGTGFNHTSHHGLGPWEVSIARAFDSTISDPTLVAEANAIVASRWYGPSGVARTRNQTRSQLFAPSAGRFTAASLVSWDATGTGVPLGIPSFPTNPFNVTANFGGSGFYDDNTGTTQADQHPSLYNPGEWGNFAAGGGLNPLPEGASYPHADTRRLRQRYSGEYDLYNQSTLARLPNLTPSAIRPGVVPATKSLVGDAATYPPGTPNYRNDPAHGRRQLFTTLSADLDRPRFGPSSTSPNTNTGFALGGGIHPSNAALGGTLNAGGTAAILPALDLNRPLADYRDLAGGPNVDNTTTPPTPTPQPISSSNIANSANAAADRQNLAREVFARLLLATAARVNPDGSGGFEVRTYNSTTMAEETVAKITPSTAEVEIPISKDAAGFQGVRYLAQLAANIVDYMDTDDVSTVFVFRPSPYNSGSTISYVDAATHTANVNAVVSNANASDPTNENYIGNHLVFGVEMPRLLLNEVYSEVANDPGDMIATKGNGMPTKEGHVRFWVELVNPTTTPYASGTGPLGDGSVTFADTTIRPYKLTIARNTKTGFTNDVATELAKSLNVKGDLPTGAAADIDYDFRDAGAGMKSNVVIKPNKGKYNPGSPHPDNGFVIVGPKANSTRPTDEFDPTNGGMPAAPFDTMIETPPVLSGMMATGPAMEYLIPVDAPGPMDPGLKTLDLTQTNSPLRRHVVLLRRLANPYEAESPTNPYVTVDTMDYVPANDGVYSSSLTMPVGGVTMANRFSVGRVQPFAGQSKQDTPMAPAVAAFTFPNSFLLAQTTAGTANQPKHTFGRHNGNAATDPTATAFTDGSPASMTPASLSDTIMAPFDWFIHLDRPLVNELELLHVQAVKPHQVTQYTFQPPQNANEAVRRSLGLAPWLGVPSVGSTNPPEGYPTYDAAHGFPAFQTSTTGPHVNATRNGLYRAFELLRGKSRVFGTATGGRVQGKVNINTVQDPRVLLALLDPQAGNVFSVGEVFNPADHTDAKTIWGRFIRSRTRGLSQRALADTTTQVFTTTPGKTIDDDPFDGNWQNLDRPFKAFGVAEAGMPAGFGASANQILVGGGNSAATDGAMPTPTATPFGPGLQDTLLRSDVRTDPNDATKTLGVMPLAYTVGTNAIHPYLQAEALRKLLNNTTTVSNVFGIHVTIVYHNVRMNAPNDPHREVIAGLPAGTNTRHYFGTEAFREVPGDMRKQYYAIVDRSQASLVDPNSQNALTNPFQAALANGFTLTSGSGQITLAGAVANAGNNTVSVASDGQVYTLTAANPAPGGQFRSIYIGSGVDRVQVDITGITVDTTVTPNTARLTVTQPAMGTTTRTFPAGATVSNGVPGRPTYPVGFNPLQPGQPFQLLVPYCGRIRE
ncbi:hypothetical protein J0H58_19270 [bacterium]|nr:hypothetical protein [bacterium]